MKFTSERPVMIFKNTRQDSNGVTRYTYTMGLSKKDMDGNYENGYWKVEFKKDVILENQTKMIIKNAFPTFYKKHKLNEDGTENTETVVYLFVTDFDVIDGNADVTATKREEKEEEDPFADFGSSVEENNFLD